MENLMGGADIRTVVFVVEPENQETLLELLQERAERVMSKQPGHVEATVGFSALAKP
jgi:hypothetical protein